MQFYVSRMYFLFKLPCIANLAMSEEVEDGTEVLRVTIYQECSALILEGIIVMWLQYVN